MTQINALSLTRDEARDLAVIAKRTNASTPIEFAMAGMKASLASTLRERMQKEVVEFYFIKGGSKPGYFHEIRRAFGTTMPALAGSKILGTGIPRKQVNCIAFWDVEIGAWRSARIESLLKVC